ncbi:septal ring factor EnvC (AmiA/AmiB activator) [Bacillus ectoiniformans]|nr:hypothetical protein [Bacillus ectoiniformans]MBM7649203.1 septal ring factor EnvC (AmiA/AmiB activator) [Bacillus ectoiniformans]
MENKEMNKLLLRLNQLEEKVLELDDKLQKTQHDLKEMKKENLKLMK